MNKLKVQETTTELKYFFEKKKVTVSEAKESMFRLIDYIDVHFDEDSLNIPFKNGNGFNGLNGKVNKVDTPQKGIKLEIKNR